MFSAYLLKTGHRNCFHCSEVGCLCYSLWQR